jgi:hypothetical protein
VRKKNKDDRMKMYKCSSAGPQNNGRVKKCAFQQEFEVIDKYTYNCPICANPLEEVDELDNQ